MTVSGVTDNQSIQGFLLPHSFLLELQTSLKESMDGAAQGLQETILTTVNHLIEQKLSAPVGGVPGTPMGTVKRPKRTHLSLYKRTAYNVDDESPPPSKSRGSTTNFLHVNRPRLSD